ncbi:MAG: rod shape-determining protein [Clostridia bacterium]|nr:rod shape-determining protein [Clostridia bacterium]
MQWDIALELGENTVRLATRENGLAFSAPSLGALRGDRLVAIGEDAQEMQGRAPAGVRVARPLENGRVCEPKLAAQWLTRLLEPFTSGAKLSRPSVVFVDNGFMSRSEKEMLVNTALELGAGECGLLSSDIAAAAGAGMDIRRGEGFALADIGAGRMSVTLISYGRIARARRVPFGMNRVDEDIARLVRARAALSIGPRTAEDVKLVLASALPAREVTCEATGLDMATGFPGAREINALLVREAVEPVVDALALAIQETVQDAPDELSADLLRTGVILTGGGALLSGLDKALSDRCGLGCHIPETPGLCTGKGMARILQDPVLSDMAVRRPGF